MKLTLIVLSLVFLTQVQADDIKAESNSWTLSQASNADESSTRELLWENRFNSNSGFPSTRLLENPEGKQTDVLIDDFKIPDGEMWRIESIQPFVFWKNRQPDSLEIIIYADDGSGFPKDDKRLYDFNVYAEMPSQMNIYSPKLDVKSHNISLSSGGYWFGVMGLYETGVTDDTLILYWLRKDTLISYEAKCADSIGYTYGNQVPTGWLNIWGGAPEEPFTSLRFDLWGTKGTPIKNHIKDNRQKSMGIYPNLSMNQLFIQLPKKSSTSGYLEIFSSGGQKVKRTSINPENPRVEIADLHNGVYLYKLYNQGNIVIEKGRFSLTR